MPPKFFITHSWHDIEFAKQFTDAMRGAGLDGFFDAYSLYPGDVVTAEIQKGLEACDVYVPILSDAALRSPWCEEEMPGRNGRPRIIPVLVEPVQDRMSIFLRARLFVRFEDNFQHSFQEFWRGVMVTPTAKMAPPAPTVLLADEGEGERAGVDRPTLERMQKRKKELPPRIFNKVGHEMILILGSTAEIYTGEGGAEGGWEMIYLKSFYISRYPVTNSDYKKFVDATNYSSPTHWTDGKIPTNKENHPVVYVSWNDIMKYCKWADARVPTLPEWQKAGFWDNDKQERRKYPWGNSFYIERCNSKESQYGDTTPVGKYSPAGDSFYEIGDMAGNVWEWIPSHSANKLLRGGSFVNDQNHVGGSYFIYNVNPDVRGHDMGFRIARAAIEDDE